jgi:hypothetical protein
MKRFSAEPSCSTAIPAAIAPMTTGLCCATCDIKFTKQSNLKRHVETKHTDQTTPEAVAKRLKVKEYRKKNRHKRRATDSVYREKQNQISRTNRMNKNACKGTEDGDHAGVSNDVKAKDESMLVETEAEKKDGVAWMPTDIVHTPQPPDTPEIGDLVVVGDVLVDKNDAPEIGDLVVVGDVLVDYGHMGSGVGIVDNSIDKNDAPEMRDEENVRGGGVVGGRVNKTRKKENPTRLPLRVETTALTTANVISFFTPRYNTPRSKAQRVASPRPSVI